MDGEEHDDVAVIVIIWKIEIMMRNLNVGSVRLFHNCGTSAVTITRPSTIADYHWL